MTTYAAKIRFNDLQECVDNLKDTLKCETTKLNLLFQLTDEVTNILKDELEFSMNVIGLLAMNHEIIQRNKTFIVEFGGLVSGNYITILYDESVAKTACFMNALDDYVKMKEFLSTNFKGSRSINKFKNEYPYSWSLEDSTIQLNSYLLSIDVSPDYILEKAISNIKDSYRKPEKKIKAF